MQLPEKYGLQAQIRNAHEKRLIMALLRHGPMSRADLARTLDISLTSASALCSRMLESGWIVWTGALNCPDVGRPAERLALREEALCVPVLSARRGGIRAALYSLSLRCIQSDFFPYPSDFMGPGQAPRDAYMGFPVVEAERFGSFAASCVASLSSMNIAVTPGIILSMPGNFMPQDPYFTAAPLRFAIHGDFLACMERGTGLPVMLGNDSDFIAYGHKSVPGDNDSFIFININDGVGAGIVYHGDLFRTGQRHAAEIGHLSINPSGIPCGCGGRGCLERYISFPAIVERVGTLWGKSASVDEVVSAYRNGDAQACSVIENVAEQLALGISNMLAIFDSERVIVGGGIERFGETFLSSLQRCMGQSPVRHAARHVSVRYPESTRADDCEGAALYFMERVWRVQTGQEGKVEKA